MRRLSWSSPFLSFRWLNRCCLFLLVFFLSNEGISWVFKWMAVSHLLLFPNFGDCLIKSLWFPLFEEISHTFSSSIRNVSQQFNFTPKGSWSQISFVLINILIFLDSLNFIPNFKHFSDRVQRLLFVLWDLFSTLWVLYFVLGYRSDESFLSDAVIDPVFMQNGADEVVISHTLKQILIVIESLQCFH